MKEDVGTLKKLNSSNYKTHSLMEILKKHGPVIHYPTLFSLFSAYKIEKRTAWVILRKLSEKGTVYLSRKYVVVLYD